METNAARILTFAIGVRLRYHDSIRVKISSAIFAMTHLSYHDAYPGLSFRPRTTNWLARLIRMPAECVHLDGKPQWMATFLPDNLYLRGKNRLLREPARPEVSLCSDCLNGLLEKELASFPGRVIAFEPDGASVTQYFYVASQDFDAAGLEPSVAEAIGNRLNRDENHCRQCSRAAKWRWFSRKDVASLDDVGSITAAAGEPLCAEHGAKLLCSALAAIPQVNLFYLNVPYGECGAYLWI